MNRSKKTDNNLVQNRPVGRPSKYKPEYVELVYNYALLGAINEDLAMFFEVDISTIYYWLDHYPEFSEAFKRGKALADATAVKRLFQLVNGYTYTETTYETTTDPNKKNKAALVKTRVVEKHVPPSITAVIYWLQNRQRKYWKDRRFTEIAGKDGKAIEVHHQLDLSSLSTKELKTLERIIGKVTPGRPSG